MKKIKFVAHVDLDMNWEFEVLAENEDAAYEELWNLIGYDGEDIVQFDHEPISEYFNVNLRMKEIE